MLNGCAGVIIHPTSLPGPYGIGEIGSEAIKLVDWMVSAGLSLWQASWRSLDETPAGSFSSPPAYTCRRPRGSAACSSSPHDRMQT